MTQTLGFSNEEYTRRMRSLQAELDHAGLDALLAFTSSWFRTPGAVCYCCGYEPYFGSAAFVLVASTGERHLLVDNFWDVVGRPEEERREREQFHLVEDLGPAVAKLLPQTVRRLGIVNERFMSPAIYRSLHGALSAIEFVDGAAPFDAVREVKSDEELALLRWNASLSDVAAQTFLDRARAGTTEKAVANAMLNAALEAGADRFWTPVSVASGPRTALYYAFPTQRVIEPGDMAHTDVGVQAGGYHGDIQRAAIVPGTGPAVNRRILDGLLEVQASLIQAIRPGIRACDFFKVFLRLAEEHDLAEFAPRRWERSMVGHGIGSDGHESPSLSEDDQTLLRANMVVTLEPLFIQDGVGGAGVEDMVLITPNGGERLTHAPWRTVG